MTTIWQGLTHDSIFNAVEAASGTRLSNVLYQRNSYINRVFEVEEHDSRQRLIVKFYRPGRWTEAMIQEEHDFLKELAGREIPVIPPIAFNGKTLFSFGPIPYALFPKKGGRALDEFDQTGWETIGRLLARIHQVSAIKTGTSRITWRPSVATRHHLEILDQSGYLLPDFRPAFNRAAESFIAQADSLFNQEEFILLHGDLHKGNLIHRPGEGIFIVDFDDLCFGPPVQDIWMLLPGGVEHSEQELEWLFKGYEIFRPFDRKSLTLIPALRGMRLIHFAAWQAIQSREPDFERHFPEAGNTRYWNELVKELDNLL
ncbi:MAG: serine/threonine protein kinase [Candidatus Margulisbacteria bacterium]|nr:serine/threonine protein kinase [Candidatus Margulisiibacteriota bacterium]